MKIASWTRGIRFLLWALALSATSAQAFELSLVGGADLSKPSIQLNGVNTGGVSFKPSFGGGLLMGFESSAITEIQLGALYMNRDYKYPVASGTGEDSYARYEVPLLLRFTGLPILSVGAGVYYAVPVGTYTYTQTPLGGTSSSTTSNASDAFKNDFGAIGSVALKIPFNPWTSLLIDGRYEYGLFNITKTAGETFKTRDIEALAGFALGF
jgi:hypothetical protein